MSNTYAWVAKPKDRYIVYGGITGNEVRHRINGGYRFPKLGEKVRRRHINLLHDEEVAKPWRGRPDDNKTPRWMYLMDQFTEQTIINTCRKVAEVLSLRGIDVVCGNIKNAVSQYDVTEFADWVNNQRSGQDYDKDLYGKITDFIEERHGEFKAKRQKPVSTKEPHVEAMNQREWPSDEELSDSEVLKRLVYKHKGWEKRFKDDPKTWGSILDICIPMLYDKAVKTEALLERSMSITDAQFVKLEKIRKLTE